MPDGKSIRESAARFDDPKSARKPEDLFSRGFLRINAWLNRPAASLIVRALYRTRVTPNQVTFMAFFIGLAAACFLFTGRPSMFLIGGILTQVSSIFDCADGMLARARDQQSRFGGYLDLFLDRINEFFIMAGYAAGCYRFSGRLSLLVLGLLGTGLYFLQICLFYLTKNYRQDYHHGEMDETRAALLFLIFLFAATNRLEAGLYVLASAAVVANIVHIFGFFRLKRT